MIFGRVLAIFITAFLFTVSFLPAAQTKSLAELEKEVKEAKELCATRAEAIEKKYSKKKDEKYQKEKQDALARNRRDYYIAVSSAIFDLRLLKKTDKQADAYCNTLIAERKDLIDELYKLAEQGCKVMMYPSELRWKPFKEELEYCQRMELKNGFKEEDVLAELNTGRLTGMPAVYKDGDEKVKPLATNANDDGMLVYHGNINTDHVYWIYINSPKEQKASIKISTTKGDKLTGVYLNLETIKAKSGTMSLALNEGVNLIVFNVKNDDKPEIGAAVKFKGKDLEYGR
ncbi:MAG: hypothetical protein JXR97_01640 [Planctomycetes bacterium]|nr:hypothetical protein [Planctomycetota bacterium]